MYIDIYVIQRKTRECWQERKKLRVLASKTNHPTRKQLHPTKIAPTALVPPQQNNSLNNTHTLQTTIRWIKMRMLDSTTVQCCV